VTPALQKGGGIMGVGGLGVGVGVWGEGDFSHTLHPALGY